MEKIEDFIRKNRDELDRHDPSPEIWNGIENDLPGKRPGVFRWLLAAAMITVIFTTAALFYVAESRKNFAYNSKSSDARIMKANPLLKETEIYYNNLINDLYDEATPMLTAHPDVRLELISDLSQVDSICTNIKQDLRDNIANQEVIEALVNNYRVKIRILEEMLDVLNQNENNPQKNESHAL